jgi:hypothetical protein
MNDANAPRSNYALCAVLLPLGCTLFGIVLGVARPQSGDFVTVLVWASLAAVSGVFCAAKSIMRRERWRRLAIVGALLGVIPLALVAVALSNFRLAF